MAERAYIKRSVQDAILVEARRRCCICFGLSRDFDMKVGQLAHLDHNSTNSAPGNLAFLCWLHHNEYDSKTSQSKNFTQGEVRQYRIELLDQIRRVFHPESETRQIEVTPVIEGIAISSPAAPTATSAHSISEPPAHWRLRYLYDFPSAAHLGRFHDKGSLIVADGAYCSWHFNDSAEDMWTFQIPEELRDLSEKSGADTLAVFVGETFSVNVYGRSDGRLSVGTVRFCGSEVSKPEWEMLMAHRRRPCFAGFGPDGNIFLSGDEAGELLVWDWPARRKTHRLPSLVGPISSANLNHSIDRVVVTGRNGKFEIFELSTARSLGSGIANVRGGNAQVHHALDPAYLVAHDGADRFEALETTSLKLAPRSTWPGIWVNIKAAANGQTLAVWTVTGAVLAGVRNSGEPIGRDAFEMLSPPGRRVSDYEVSSDGERIAFLMERKALQVWEPVSRPDSVVGPASA